MKKALLLGNGLNRLNEDYSWGRLIEDLLAVVDAPNPPRPEGKPFPLFYEEIVQAAYRIGMSEAKLKKELAALVERISGSDLHGQLTALEVQEIVTTNYDYNIEASLPQEEPQESDTSESKYSLFRRKAFSGLDVWHIHGERDRPESILLGFEQYSGYLQAMRDYMLRGHERRQVDPLFSRIKKQALGDDAHSWIDLFFNSNLYILGLDLDYVEMHLWWLITYRARLRSQSEFPINNKVTYVYPRFLNQEIRSRLQLLLGAGILLSRIDVKSGRWMDFYEHALEVIRQS